MNKKTIAVKTNQITCMLALIYSIQMAKWKSIITMYKGWFYIANNYVFDKCHNLESEPEYSPPKVLVHHHVHAIIIICVPLSWSYIATCKYMNTCIHLQNMMLR